MSSGGRSSDAGPLRPGDPRPRRQRLDTTLLLEAGAGTGKTTVLVGRLLALLRKGRTTIDRIAARLRARMPETEIISRGRHDELIGNRCWPVVVGN